ncbi:MAG: hypothetical protein AMXMBFR17_18920 [Candidatus Jettenia caeni]
MEIGETITKTIRASKKWNNTQIRPVAGEEYHFKASGQWKDWNIVCDADGYISPNLLLRATEWLRRVPKECWFTLIGSLDGDKDTCFRIGVEARISPKLTGTLYCFANDINLMYWNNRGEIQLTVTRTR